MSGGKLYRENIPENIRREMCRGMSIWKKGVLEACPDPHAGLQVSTCGS